MEWFSLVLSLSVSLSRPSDWLTQYFSKAWHVVIASVLSSMLSCGAMRLSLTFFKRIFVAFPYNENIGCLYPSIQEIYNLL